MGNWRNRHPRRFFHSRRVPNSPHYDHEVSDSGFCNDGVPPWEKKFCRLIGSVPWWKVEATKKYTICHGNILNWDDSAGEEAFHNAKKRFWATINGLPFDILLPDPDIYIDKINWNPIIDLKLIEDLEQAYFVPEEAEDGNKVKRNLESVPPEECKQNSDKFANPWESSNNKAQDDDLVQSGSQGWRCWNSDSDMLRNSKKEENKGAQTSPKGNKAAKDTWRDCSEKIWNWNQGTNTAKQTIGWDNNDSQWGHSCKDKWLDNHRDNSWGLKWQESKMRHSDCAHGEHNFIPDSGDPKDFGWADGGDAWNGGHISKSYRKPQTLEIQRASQGLAAWNGSYRKREGSHQYRTDCKSSRFRWDNNQTGQFRS